MVDTSVAGRAAQPRIGEIVTQLVDRWLMWTCRIIDLEMLYAARARDSESTMRSRLRLPHAPVGPEVLDRALEVSIAMTRASLHRGSGPADLIIAAAAESAGLTVLHYDHDFERIARVTGQPTEWVAPPGSLD